MNKIIKSTIILICFIFNKNLIAQSDSTFNDTVFNGHVVSSDWIDQGITIGVNISNYLYGEIGYHKSYIWEAGGFPTLSTTMNYGAEFSNIENLKNCTKNPRKNSRLFF